MGAGDLRFGDLRILASSRAGEATWIRVHPPGLAFDVGRGAPELVGCSHLIISHGHLDHSLGVPYLLSQRALHRLGPTRVYCPREMAEAMGRLVASAEELEGGRFDFQLVPLEAGDRIKLPGGMEVIAFATDHLVPSLGFHLVRRKRRLSPEFRGLSSREIVALRRSGRRVELEEEELCVTYSGDTGAELFYLEPRLFSSRVLILECTFLADEYRRRSRQFKHLHLEDLVEQADRFENEALVLLHLSKRHRLSELREKVLSRLPDLADRIHLVGAEEVRV